MRHGNTIRSLRGMPASGLRHHNRSRTGWTLVEMLVTISVMATMTGIVVKTLTAMLLSERSGIEHVSRLATLSRLARQFRTDVHAAAKLEISSDLPDKPLLLLTIGDNHNIQYESQPLGLLRTERRANQPLSRELWRLKPAQFQCVESTGSPRFLTLVVGTLEPNARNKSVVPTMKELRIDAAVGRDREQPTSP